jgi:hypothetical protein
MPLWQQPVNPPSAPAIDWTIGCRRGKGHGMGDTLDMMVDATDRAMHGLAAVGTDLTRDCQTARSRIESLTGTLGRGPLGARFMANFASGQRKLDQDVTATDWVPTALAGAGQDCVRNYATTEAHAEAELLRAKFP